MVIGMEQKGHCGMPIVGVLGCPSGKKRPIESATKTLVAAKNAKLDTPQQKTDGKKGGHTATAHPSKNLRRTAACPKFGQLT